MNKLSVIIRNQKEYGEKLAKLDLPNLEVLRLGKAVERFMKYCTKNSKTTVRNGI